MQTDLFSHVRRDGTPAFPGEITIITRNESYAAIDLLISQQQQVILRLLVQHPDGLSNQEIERLSGLRISSVCGRMAELRKVLLVNDEPLIISAEPIVRIDECTGKSVAVFRLNPKWERPSEVLE